MDDEGRVYLQCECHLQDHLVSFELQDWANPDGVRRPDDVKLLIHPLLNPNPSFFKRVWLSVRYIFGKPAFHFDEIIIPATELEGLDRLVRRACSVAKLRTLANQKRKGGRVV